VVYGISKDKPATNARWAEQEGLPFPLLTDPGGELRTKLGHPEEVDKPVSRITYVVDRKGVVRHIVWFKGRADVMEHITQSLEALKGL